MAKVSIIIPTYDRSTLVKKTIESVLLQTHNDIEAIVVDDGSTDDTENIIKLLGDNRIRYFFKQNEGVSSARNLGLTKAKGDYIWPNNFLEVMLKKMDENPDYSATYCSRTVFYPDGREIEFYMAQHSKSGSITKDLFKKTFIQTSTICFRRQHLEGFFFDTNLNNSEDSDAWLRLSRQIKFLFIPEIQILFRAGHNIKPRTDFSADNCNRIRVLERFYFRLDGDKYVPKKLAMRKLSHAYRSVAVKQMRSGNKDSAILLYKGAIKYWPFDLRLYAELIKTLLIKKSAGKTNAWKMPEPLPNIEP